MNTEELRESYGRGWPKTEEYAMQMAERVLELEEKYQNLKRKEFDELGKEIHETNVEKGFWSEPVMMDKYVAKLALIHSELTEVLEALRKSQGADKVTEEFADVLIRTFDLYDTLVEAGEADPELYGVMRDKMEVNKNRAPKHGNRWG